MLLGISQPTRSTQVLGSSHFCPVWDSSKGQALLRSSPLSCLNFISFALQCESTLSNFWYLESYPVPWAFGIYLIVLESETHSQAPLEGRIFPLDHLWKLKWNRLSSQTYLCSNLSFSTDWSWNFRL